MRPDGLGKPRRGRRPGRLLAIRWSPPERRTPSTCKAPREGAPFLAGAAPSFAKNFSSMHLRAFGRRKQPPGPLRAAQPSPSPALQANNPSPGSSKSGCPFLCWLMTRLGLPCRLSAERACRPCKRGGGCRFYHGGASPAAKPKRHHQPRLSFSWVVLRESGKPTPGWSNSARFGPRHRGLPASAHVMGLGVTRWPGRGK